MHQSSSLSLARLPTSFQPKAVTADKVFWHFSRLCVCVGAPDPRRQDEMTLKYDHKIHNAGRFMVSRFVGRSLSVMSTPDRQVVALILERFLSFPLPPKQCKT